MWGIGGQLAGHGVVWAKQIASGTPIMRVLTPETLFWAAFSIASETITTTASSASGTSVAGIAVPAALQITVLDMYHTPTKQVVPKLMRGEVAALLDDASIAGILGAVIAKSYA